MPTTRRRNPMNPIESSRNLMTRVGNEAIAELEQGRIPWNNGVSRLDLLAYNGESGRRYNILNQFGLPMGGAYYTRTAIMNMNAANGVADDPERRISWAGQNPYWVRQWYPIRDRDHERTADEEQDDDIRGFAFGATPVFHVSQLRNFPEQPARRIGQPHMTLRALLEGFAEAKGITILHSNSFPSGIYSPHADAVDTYSRDQYGSDMAYLSDLAHELFHATGAPNRLHRFETSIGLLSRHQTCTLQELTCEIATAMLMSRFAYTLFIANEATYIANWLEFLRRDPTAYSKACTAAEKAVAYMAPELFPAIIPVEGEAHTAPAPAPVPSVTCDSCGCIISGEPIMLLGRYPLCRDCDDNMGSYYHLSYGHLHGTGGRADNTVHLHGETNHRMGFECETSPDLTKSEHYLPRACRTLNYISNKYDNKPLWHTTSDCTIGNRNGSGIEIVSHPADMAWWSSNTAIEDMCEVAKANGFYSHDSLNDRGDSACGLHVHCSREWISPRYTDLERHLSFRKAYAKVVAILCALEKEPSRKSGWSTLERFGRRKSGEYRRSLSNLVNPMRWENEEQAAQRVWVELSDERYRTCRATSENAHTIEFRFARGTINPRTIRATLQLCSNIMDFSVAKSLDECKTATMKDIIAFHEYTELVEYAQSKRLY